MKSPGAPDQPRRLPKAPAFVDGVINLRGIVVPIVDLRRRFDIELREQKSKAARSHLGDRRQAKTGFMVDSVSEVHEGSRRCHPPGARDFAGADAPDWPRRKSGMPEDA